MTQSEYITGINTTTTLAIRASKSKSVRRKLMRKLCTDLNFKADAWELALNQKTLLQLAVSRVAYGTLTVKQKNYASKLLTY